MALHRMTCGGLSRPSWCCVLLLMGISTLLLFCGFRYWQDATTSISDTGHLLTANHIGKIAAADNARYRGFKPIDVVYTWVNGSDPQFQLDLDKYVTLAIKENKFSGEAHPRRYKDSDELRFSLRSLEKFAPWVRHVYLVTNGQIPYWLDVDCPYVTLVTHEDIFGATARQFLPTFSSGAIEARLFRIKGLGDYSIFFNDDLFFGRPVFPHDFISPLGEQKFYLEQSRVVGSCGCGTAIIRDGLCDEICNKENSGLKKRPSAGLLPCFRGCLNAMLGDGICNLECDFPSCAFDAGDCGVAKLTAPGPHLFHVSPRNHTDLTISVPKPHRIVVADLSSIVGHGRERKFVNCSTENGPTLKSASLINNDSVLVVMAYENISYTTYDCTLAFTDNSVVKLSIKFYPFASSSTHSESSSRMKSQIGATIEEKEAFSGSLIYVNGIFDRDFGHARRHQPAHAPTLFQRKIVAELYERYRDEFSATASRRFRSSKDMQLHFSYIHYMTSLLSADSEDGLETVMDQLFLDEFDVDRSGDLDKNEFMKLYKQAQVKLQLKWPTFFLEIQQSNCFSDSAKLRSASKKPKSLEETRWLLTLKDLKKCPPLRKLFLMLAKRQPRYRWKIQFVGGKDSKIYRYVGIQTVDDVERQMDKLRRLRPKFFCLNNIVEDIEVMATAYAKVREFLLEQFPQPSRFELPLGHHSRVKSIGELRQLKTKHTTYKVVAVGACFPILILLVFCFSHSRRLTRVSSWDMCHNLRKYETQRK